MKFTTGEVISAGTGMLCCPIGDVYKIFNFLTNDNLYTHQLPRAGRVCKEHIEGQCPWLKDLNKEDCTPDTWRDWLTDAIIKYGNSHELQPLPPDTWNHVNPIKEAVDMMGADKVMVAVKN